jgi:hypothetical protein
MRHIDKSLAKGLASQTLRQADARGEHAQDVVITHMSKIGMSARHQIRTMRRILEHTGPGLVSHRFEFPGRHFQAVFEFWNLGKSSIVKKEFEEHGLTTQYMTVGVRARSEVISEWPADSCFYISLHALQRVIMRGGLDTTDAVLAEIRPAAILAPLVSEAFKTRYEARDERLTLCLPAALPTTNGLLTGVAVMTRNSVADQIFLMVNCRSYLPAEGLDEIRRELRNRLLSLLDLAESRTMRSDEVESWGPQVRRVFDDCGFRLRPREDPVIQRLLEGLTS